MYDKDIPDYSDVMPIKEFRDAVNNGLFIDYDGHGYPAKDGKMDRKIVILPSQFHLCPIDATHIIWFNR